VTKLVCPDCRHENEAERIYCHSCGARLDRSALKKNNEKADQSDGTQEHLRRMFDPRRGRNLALFYKLLRVVLGAFALAVVIQMLLPPDLPPVEAKSDFMAPMINMDMMTALETHTPPTLTYSQEQVNSYLAGTIRRSNSPAKEGFVPIRRLFVQLNEGACQVNCTYSCLGLPVTVAAIYGVDTKAESFSVTCRGGYIGRMPILPALMSQAGFLFHKAWLTLERERKQVARMSAVEFHPQSVTLRTTPQS
jgi:hypothetical protein